MKTYIAEKLAIIDVATQGEWKATRLPVFSGDGYNYGGGYMVAMSATASAVIGETMNGAKDATFIADSRNHRRAELEVIGMLWDAWTEAKRILHDHGSLLDMEVVMDETLQAARKKLETP